MACVSGSGGGKSTDITNFLLRFPSLRDKFGRGILSGPNCLDFPEEFYNCGTLEELFNLIRAKPKFNPYWMILIDFLWGRQSTRDWLEFYTTQGQLEGRYDELRSRERDEDETENFVRPAGEKQTLVFNDDQDIASDRTVLYTALFCVVWVPSLPYLTHQGFILGFTILRRTSNCLSLS